MYTSAPQSAKVDHQFIQQQHFGVGHTSDVHTQDFLLPGSADAGISSGTSSTVQYITLTLTSFGNLIQMGNMFQTYKFNSVEAGFYYGGFTGTNAEPPRDGIFLSIIPYSRNFYTSGGSTNQAIAIRAIPGCAIKYFAAASQAGGTEQPQMLKCINNNPMYSISDVGQTGTATGQVFSNGALALQSGQGMGTDTTNWYCFMYETNVIGDVANALTIHWNVLLKVNVTFEGLRWMPTVLFPPAEGSHLLGNDSDDDDAQETNTRSGFISQADVTHKGCISVCYRPGREDVPTTTSSLADFIREICEEKLIPPRDIAKLLVEPSALRPRKRDQHLRSSSPSILEVHREQGPLTPEMGSPTQVTQPESHDVRGDIEESESRAKVKLRSPTPHDGETDCTIDGTQEA